MQSAFYDFAEILLHTDIIYIIFIQELKKKHKSLLGAHIYIYVSFSVPFSECEIARSSIAA